MRTMLLVTLTLAIAGGSLAACQPGAAPAPTLAPLVAPTVSLNGVFVVYPGHPAAGVASNVVQTAAGADGKVVVPAIVTASYVLDTTFTISNPNAYPVTMDRLDFALSAADQILFYKGTSDDVFVPALGQARVTLTNVMTFNTLFLEGVVKLGKSPADSIKEFAPLWGNMKDGKATYKVDGTAAITSQGGPASIPFTFTYPKK